MFSTILVACVLAANSEGAANATPNVDAYKQAKAQTGRDADSQIRLALWCEAHGMAAERVKHLTIATLVDPQNATARGLLGMVQHEGKWLSPDAIAEQLHNDPKYQASVRDYLERRARTPDKPDDQNKLANWCEENGLKDQAQAHFYRTVQLDPSREQAWKHLGYKKEKGRWAKPEQLAAEKELFELQTKANKYWKPILTRLWNGLTSRSPGDRARAQASIDEIHDSAAVPMIWQAFAQKDPKRQELAVRLLGQVDAASASRALAMLSMLTQSTDIRREAVTVLKQRDPRDFVEVLTSMIRSPIVYEVRRKAGLNTPGELFVKGTDKNFRRLYDSLRTPEYSAEAGDIYTYDKNGLPVVRRVFSRESGLLGMMLPLSTSSGPVTASEASMVFSNMGLVPSADLMQAFATNSAMGFGSVTPLDANQLAQSGVPSNIAGALAKASKNQGRSAILTGTTIEVEQVHFARLYGTVESRLEIPVGQMIVDAQLTAQQAEQKLQEDVRQIEAYNRPVRDLNRKSRSVLSETVGTDLGDDAVAWDNWSRDLLGLLMPIAQTTRPTPTVVEEVPIDYQPQAIPNFANEITSGYFIRMASCFAAGTMVHTNDGLQPIEKIQPGDLVLSQDTSNGRVSYNPVLNVFHNPPKETFKISFEGSSETISPTGIHRFWKAGQGWIMARDLKPGDVLRTIGGSVTVRAIDPDQTQPVFNLRVGNAEDFFVGQAGVLAHDNKVVGPVDKPFDHVGLIKSTSDRKN